MDTQKAPDQPGILREEATPAGCGRKIAIITDSDEKQALLSKEASSVGGTPDLEAQVDSTEAPTTHVVCMDNIRTTTIALLVIQNALIVAISVHPDSARLDEITPKSFAAATIFIGMGRLLLVPTLFFVSGFSSRFAMNVHSNSALHFIGLKIRKAIVGLALFQALAWILSCITNAVPEGTGSQLPYYASKAGRDALINGPTSYIMALLFLDCIYLICHKCNTLIYGDRRVENFINSLPRLGNTRAVLLVLVELYIILHREIGLNHLPESWRNQIYAANSAELHFPILYAVAYFSGIHLVAYYKFVLAEIKQHHVFVLILRLGLSTISLGALHYYFPDTIRLYLDIRVQPPMVIPTIPLDEGLNSGAHIFYGFWAVFTILNFHDALIAAFTIRALSRPWGWFPRGHSVIQTYVQVFLVFGRRDFQPSYIDNVLVQGLIIGSVSLATGYSHSVCVDFLAHGPDRKGWTRYFKPAVCLEGMEHNWGN